MLDCSGKGWQHVGGIKTHRCPSTDLRVFEFLGARWKLAPDGLDDIRRPMAHRGSVSRRRRIMRAAVALARRFPSEYSRPAHGGAYGLQLHHIPGRVFAVRARGVFPGAATVSERLPDLRQPVLLR